MTLNESNEILIGGRAKNVVQRNLDPNMFPFDAFEFDDPNRNSSPALRMKYPWNLQIGNESLPWTEEKHGIIPSNGWFTELLDFSDVTLELESSAVTVSPSMNNLTNAAYGVTGYVEYDLSSIPSYSGAYTIICRINNSWSYKTSGGIDNSTNILVTGTILKIWTGFNFTLPFTLSYTSQSFRELLIIPQAYSQGDIEAILNDSDTFIEYLSSTGPNPSLTLSSKGLLWKSGDKFIRLGDTASFHGVDLDSGNFVQGSQGWQITSDGNVEFNDGVFRGELSGASGTFSGELQAATGDFSGTVHATDGEFTGYINAISGNFSGYLDSTTIKTAPGGAVVIGPRTESGTGAANALYRYFICTEGLTDGNYYKIDSGTNIPSGTMYIRFVFTKTGSADWYVYAYNSNYTLLDSIHSYINQPSASVTSCSSATNGTNSWGTVTISLATGGDKLIFKDLPTASTGLEIGRVWNDGGTLKIVS